MPAPYAWVCDLHATKTSRAWRHPKVPVPVESWAAAESTKVPLCQCPAAHQTQVNAPRCGRLEAVKPPLDAPERAYASAAEQVDIIDIARWWRDV